jgi:hypothetical protein
MTFYDSNSSHFAQSRSTSLSLVACEGDSALRVAKAQGCECPGGIIVLHDFCKQSAANGRLGRSIVEDDQCLQIWFAGSDFAERK